MLFILERDERVRAHKKQFVNRESHSGDKLWQDMKPVKKYNKDIIKRL